MNSSRLFVHTGRQHGSGNINVTLDVLTCGSIAGLLVHDNIMAGVKLVKVAVELWVRFTSFRE